MEEVACCRKCYGSKWTICAGHIRCCQCENEIPLNKAIPSTDVMKLVNDETYGVMEISHEQRTH
jgi:ribosomal protein S26